MLCRVVPGIGSKVIRVLLGFGDELRILQRFQKSRFDSAHEKGSGGENFTYDIHSRIQDRIGWRRNRHLPRSANPAKVGSGWAKPIQRTR